MADPKLVVMYGDLTYRVIPHYDRDVLKDVCWDLHVQDKLQGLATGEVLNANDYKNYGCTTTLTACFHPDLAGELEELLSNAVSYAARYSAPAVVVQNLRPRLPSIDTESSLDVQLIDVQLIIPDTH